MKEEYEIEITKTYVTGFENGEKSGYDKGYDEGFEDGFEMGGYNIRDPSYKEMLIFLHEDHTDIKNYNEETFNCLDYSATVKKNAFDKGYRCFFVVIELGEHLLGGSHAVVGFNTTDKGFVYVEPQEDKIIYPEIGVSLYDPEKYLLFFDWTVTDINIIP